MSIRTIATLAIAVVLGLIAVFILNGYLGASRKAQQQIATGPGVPVVVASQPIARGVALQPTLLKVVTYPLGSVPVGAFTTVGQLTGDKTVQRLALRTLTKDEPVLATAVSGPGGRLNLASVIDPGMQAVAVRSSDVAGVGGFILPGDRVDVMLTRSIPQANEERVNSVTQILAENVRVLGIDQVDSEETDKPAVARAVTLEVTPEQAQTITLAASVGSVSLSLRHVADVAPLSRRATSLAALGFVAPASRARAAPAAGPAAGGDGKAAVPLYGPGIVRVTRVTEATGYRLNGR